LGKHDLSRAAVSIYLREALGMILDVLIRFLGRKIFWFLFLISSIIYFEFI
jgi:hypothetical protein